MGKREQGSGGARSLACAWASRILAASSVLVGAGRDRFRMATHRTRSGCDELLQLALGLRLS